MESSTLCRLCGYEYGYHRHHDNACPISINSMQYVNNQFFEPISRPMQLNFCKVADVKTPSRSFNSDAGVDFYIPNDLSWETFTLYPNCQILIRSGIKMDIPTGHMLIAMEKSGLSQKGIICGARVVDALYQGELHIHIWNVSKENIVLRAGQKIVQFILVPIVVFELNERSIGELFEDESERGEGGFGSTGL